MENLKEISIEDIKNARKQARQNSVSTVVTGEIVESEDMNEERSDKDEALQG